METTDTAKIIAHPVSADVTVHNNVTTENGETNRSENNTRANGDNANIHASTESIPTFASILGIPITPNVYNTPLGKTRSMNDISIEEWIFIMLTIAGILTTIGFAIYYLVTFTVKGELYIMAWLIFFNIVFVVHYLWSGITRERMHELLVLVAAVVIVTIYAIINFAANVNNVTKMWRMIIAIVIGVSVVVLALHIAIRYEQSGRYLFMTIGADAKVVRMVRLLFASHSLLAFDLQLSGSMLLLVIHSYTLHTLQICVLVIGSIYVVCWTIAGYFAGRFENHKLAIGFFVGSVVLIGYIVYMLVMLVLQPPSQLLMIVTSVCAALNIVVHVSLVVVMVLVYLNFGKGIKQRVFGNGNPNDSQPTVQTSTTVTNAV